MYQCEVAASAAPTVAATGNHTSRHRIDRPPTAVSSNAAETAWTTAGTHPCINEVWFSASTDMGRFTVEPVTPSIVVFFACFEHASADQAARVLRDVERR
jgi:hypothetical protein